MTLSTYVGHTDAVWDIKLFPISIASSQLLGSISADGTLKIWDTETKGSPLKSSWNYLGTGDITAGPVTKLPVPTGLDFCPTDLKKMVVSYSNSVIKLFDIETGKEILAFKSDESYGMCTFSSIARARARASSKERLSVFSECGLTVVFGTCRWHTCNSDQQGCLSSDVARCGVRS
jgi:striatin 1/3/4